MNQSKPQSIRLHSDDNVIVVLNDLETGSGIIQENITCKDFIPAGHKVSTESIKKGSYILKYGQIISIASKDILQGEHVHTHNLEMCNLDHGDTLKPPITPNKTFKKKESASFKGYMRKNGQVATRNYIGVVASVSCSSSVARFIAEKFN